MLSKYESLLFIVVQMVHKIRYWEVYKYQNTLESLYLLSIIRYLRGFPVKNMNTAQSLGLPKSNFAL